jgi:Tfp pilus assembly protein FimT
MKTNIEAFSLLQLLIGLMIISILAALGFPAYQDLIAQHHAELAKQSLMQAIEFARAQAIYYRDKVMLSPTRTWEQGYEASIQGRVIRYFPACKGDGKIFWKGSLSARDLQFNAKGVTNYQYGAFYYSGNHGKLSWKLIVNQKGRVRVE